MRCPLWSLAVAWMAAGAIVISAGCGSSKSPDVVDASAVSVAPATPPAPAAAEKPASPQPTTADLWQAAERGNVDDVRIFLDRGVDLEAKDARGKTALQLALEKKHVDVAKLLLKQGAKLPLPPEEQSAPLVVAAKRGDLWLAKLLLECSAKVDQIDDIERTPLVWAAEKGNLALVELLLDNAADPQHKSRGSFYALARRGQGRPHGGGRCAAETRGRRLGRNGTGGPASDVGAAGGPL